MRKLLPVLVATFAAAWLAVPAFAGDPGRYVEVCKYATGTPTLSGTFTFTINNEDYSVAVGHCTAPILVPSSPVTIVEQGHDWFEVAGVNYLDANGVTHTLKPDVKDADGVGLWDGDWTVTVPVLAKGIDDETVVNFTDDPVMGNLEICKTAAPTSGVTGTFTFEISSPSITDKWGPEAGWIDNIAAPANVSVAVGACSRPIPVPAGKTIVKELETNEQTYVTDISAVPDAYLLDYSLSHAKALVRIDPSETAETVVSFENSQSSLKLCKLWGGEAKPPTTPFTFTVSADGGAASTYTLMAMSPDPDCVMVPLRYVAGSLITVTEATFPGTFVDNITWNGKSFDSDWLAEKYGDALKVDMGARTVTFPIGPGMNDVTFVNDPAPSVPLKICKLGTVTGSYSFTVAPAGYTAPFVGLKGLVLAPTTVVSPVGQCVFVGYFPYDQTVMITEAAGTLMSVTIDPTSSTAVLVGAPNLVTRSASVLLGDYDLIGTGFVGYPAIVDFTNGPASVAPTVTPTTTTTTVVAQSPTAATASTAPPTKVVAPAKAMKVASARVVTVGHSRYVVVRVNGAAKTARIHVTLINKSHKVVGTLTRYVATNKAVRVGNLRLAPSVFSVKVSL